MTAAHTFFLLASFLPQATPPQAPTPPPISVEKVADDLYVVMGGGGGNTTVYVTDEGLVLIDPKFERNNAELVARVSAISPRPIRYVFNTHAHGDHSGGNLKLAPAVIVGHSNQRQIMLKRNLPGPPQLTYGTELGIHIGGKEVVARYLGPCHTNGDSFIYLPARRVLATGDCITRGTPFAPNPPTSTRIFIDYENGGSFDESLQTIERVLRLDFDTVVPGHGPLGTKADIAQWHERLTRLRTRIVSMLREGKGRDAVMDVLVKEFEWDPRTAGDRAVGVMNELKP